MKNSLKLIVALGLIVSGSSLLEAQYNARYTQGSNSNNTYNGMYNPAEGSNSNNTYNGTYNPADYNRTNVGAANPSMMKQNPRYTSPRQSTVVNRNGASLDAMRRN